MDYMLDAIDIARSALGKVSPNPAVGAVLVKDGVVVGRGCTQPPGSDHAEKVALKQAGTQANGATMYVTLEPCCHFGRTPPCTIAIIEAKVAQVHMAMLDPNPIVSGKGCAELEAAGIKTYFGEHREMAERIMEAYIKHITTKRPFVTAKYAMSLDGKIATASGDSNWISGEASRQHVQRMRYEADAVMVGVGTVLADDPRLSLRIGDDEVRESKLRVIVDTKGRTPPDAQLFKEPGKILIATTDSIGGDSEHQYKELGAEVLKLPDRDGMVDLDALMEALGALNITSIIAEGGGTVLGSLFDRGLVDKVAIFIAPKIIGGADSQTPVAGVGIMKMEDVLRLQDINIETFEQDLLITGYIKVERTS